MRAPLFALPLLALTLVAGPGLAQTAKPREEPTPVSPVTVMPPTQKPKVTATWPAAGEAVAPGVLVLKVVFDQQMAPRDFSYGPGAGGETPECLKTPRLLNDARTFVLLCRTLPGKTYAVSLNKAPSAGAAAGGFANLAENRAEPSELSFTTLASDPVTKLRDAIKAAGLGDIDMPVEEAPRLAAAKP
ncbi:hypothetical protein PMI01_01749 [Caulobacter sp. AP07]|uniref:hypothetical protein n=1 Tax=Caulobacter sp. AP07 TaxID=1144304 RepID=UPI000271E38F|nr:hypothetical protein [Caulobacter sp. AP07]EJL34222.1 hypothetical protein PMI01_01749 [Caulobacter sp. AP07]